MRFFMLYAFIICSSFTLDKNVSGQDLLNASTPGPEDPTASVKNNDADRERVKQQLRETFSQEPNNDMAARSLLLGTTGSIPPEQIENAAKLRNDRAKVDNTGVSETQVHVEKKKWLETNELILKVFESLEQELDKVLQTKASNSSDSGQSQSNSYPSNGLVAAERSKWMATNELILKVFEALENELGSLDLRVKVALNTRNKLDRLTAKLDNLSTDKSDWIKTNELMLKVFESIGTELDEIKLALEKRTEQPTHKSKQKSRDGRTTSLGDGDGNEDLNESPAKGPPSVPSGDTGLKAKWIQTNDLVLQVLEGVEKELNRLEMKLDFGLNGAARRLSEQALDIEKQAKELNALREENDQLQTMARRHIIAIDGLDDDANETEEKLVGKIKYLFTAKLKLDKTPVIDTAHRTGKFESGGKRRVKVKLVYESDKKQIMNKRKLLFADRIYLNDDYTHYQYRNLMAIKFMKKDLDANKIVYTQKGDSLKVKGRIFRAIDGVITDVTEAEILKQAEQAKPIEPTHEKYLKALLES